MGYRGGCGRRDNGRVGQAHAQADPLARPDQEEAGSIGDTRAAAPKFHGYVLGADHAQIVPVVAGDGAARHAALARFDAASLSVRSCDRDIAGSGRVDIERRSALSARRAAVLEEIHRLASILNTRDPHSEISRLERVGRSRSDLSELADVLSAYDYWTERTDGVVSLRPRGANAPRER